MSKAVRLICIGACCLFHSIAAAAESAPLKEIVEVWKRRSAKVQSARFAWSERRMIAKGSTMNPSFPQSENPDGVLIPPEDVVHEYKKRLVIDGDRVRYQYHQARDKSKAHDIAFDRGKTTDFYSAGRTDNERFPYANVYREQEFSETSLWEIAPLFWFARPVDETLGNIKLKGLVTTERTGLIDGRECIILERVPGSGRAGRKQYWVAPGLDFSVMRYDSFRANKLYVRIDASYKAAADNLWAPSRWSVQRLSPDGDIAQSVVCEVTESAINDQISEKELAIVIPPGTMVNDVTTGEVFLQRENGVKRPLTEEEKLNATYERVVATETGEALGESWLTPFRLVLLGLLALVVVFISVRILKTKRTLRGSSTQS